MTVIVTRDVPERFRGFLSSVCLEISAGVYTSPRMNKAVRERVWKVLSEWHESLVGGAIIMTWHDPQAPGGQGLLTLGEPPRQFVETDGLILVKRDL
jgi:CRISPR-associated protein Cas2